MKKGMLITVAGMALLAGTADVRAACIPTQDCASLGYKYTAAQCPDGAIACPFDTSKFFCMEPQTCNYTYTAESCAANCQNPGSASCTKNGITYYQSCGSSKCSSGQSCNNGTCQQISGTYFYCCDDVGYGCNDYYYNCKHYTSYGDCSDVVASYKSRGCSPVYDRCHVDEEYGTHYTGDTWFFCQ